MTEITTDRLLLRSFREGDFDGLYAYLSDPETVRFEPYDPMTPEEVRLELALRITSDEMIAVEIKETGYLIGNLYLGKREAHTRELGYVFNRAYWKKGYAREAALALIQNAFEGDVHRIFAECDPQNSNSWHLLEALGMRREGFLKQNVYFNRDPEGNPIWKDTYIYAILRDEFADSKETL